MNIAYNTSPQVLKYVFLGVLLSVFVLVGIFLASKVQAQPVEASDTGRLIALHDRGVERVFLTDELTIGGALEQAGVELDPRDTVEPALDEPLVANEYNVNIYRARPLIIVDGAVRQKIITSAQTAEQIAAEADIMLYPEDVTELTRSTNIMVDGAALKLVITRATAFELTLYGDTMTARTQATTVGGMLEEKNIVLTDDDRVSVDLSTRVTTDLSVRVWREGTQTITVDEAVPFEVEQIRDANRDVGYREVQTAGQNGERSVTYEITIRDGEEVSRREIASVTTKQPQRQVEVVGVKFNYTGGPLNEEQITFLGNCESGMTANRNSGNGYYGAFQFLPATWRSVHNGPYAMPHEAPLEVQKQAVQDLLSGSNIYNQFPSCANQMRAAGLL